MLKSYMFASYRDGWNLIRCWLLSAASMHKWTAQRQDLIHLPKLTTSYKWIVNYQHWGLWPFTIYLLRNWTELGKDWLDIQRVAQSRFAYFDAIMDMYYSILCNHSKIALFFCNNVTCINEIYYICISITLTKIYPLDSQKILSTM